ncbi:hypothetical protein FB451DRAFT_1184355 [Mycena latifolia]|nr:hypothetical protein FB451DRAFT_1184355 [Mycena latifolia]
MGSRFNLDIRPTAIASKEYLPQIYHSGNTLVNIHDAAKKMSALLEYGWERRGPLLFLHGSNRNSVPGTPLRSASNITYTWKDEDKKLRALYGPVLAVTAPVKGTIHGACLNAGKTTASTGAAAYWGPNARLNTSANVWGNQTSPRAELMAVLLALKNAPTFKSLGLAQNMPFAANDACGWRCANGDILKRILTLVRNRTAPLHFCHLKRAETTPSGHLAQAIALARNACKLTRSHSPLEVEENDPMPIEGAVLDVRKDTADIPNNSGPSDEPTAKPVRSVFPLPH